jgi:Protein of unknown function (DUF1553)/Protein of unknown function (DUF1549)
VPRRRPPGPDRWFHLWALVAGVLAVFAAPATAQAPLHERVDALIAARPEFTKAAAPAASDEEFLRRVSLDLTGTIPTAADARAFLKDDAPDKRRQLIDRLLASPEYARHMRQVFDALLMERRPGKNVPEAPWQEFLQSSFAANKPWDKLVREILTADGADPATRPAARFYLDREGEPHVVTKDVSRLFLGRNYSCNQCHDSPVVDEYKQADYYGVFAFLNRSFVFTDKAKLTIYAEKADGDVTYQNVFDAAKTTKTAGPRLPGDAPVEEPTFEKGKEYDVPPANGARPVPKFSRRARLAERLATRDNRQFRRASANRFWALLMGRGLVHPVDLDHEGNPPSHPELLDLLADEFARTGFDVRAFLRELALSQTYQRSSERPADAKDAPPDLFAVAPLKPLTPEQLAWSAMQATGLTDAERQALGEKATEPASTAKLAGNVAPFVRVYGGLRGQPEGQTFQATSDQALFLANGALVRGWLAPRPGNLTDRLTKLADPVAVAEELYLSVLTRRPGDEETKDVADHLQGRDKDRTAALQELVWALVASAEFRFNH